MVLFLGCCSSVNLLYLISCQDIMASEKSEMFNNDYMAPPTTSPPPEPPPSSLLYTFALDTTAHGVSKIAKADCKVRKAAWLIALMGAFAVAAAMIGFRYVLH